MKVYYETTVPANIVKDKIKRKYGEYLQEILSKKLFPEFVKPREKLNRLDYYYNTYAEKKTVSEGVNSRYRISITVEQMRGYSSVCVNVVNGWKKLLPAKENALLNGITNIRFIVDDCIKFVEREIRRGRRYDVIIMDPPSYGRGPGGEVWKLEDELYGLLTLCINVLSDDPLFFMLNSYTTGLSAGCMQHMLGCTAGEKFGGKVDADEIGLPVGTTGLNLPCGSTAIWHREEIRK